MIIGFSCVLTTLNAPWNQVLLGEENKVDIMDLMKDEAMFAEALAVAKTSKIEWLQQQSTLLGGKAPQDSYSFRTSEQPQIAVAK
jgi:uncharacterized protein with ACT and thioredoxin-like domain